MPRIRDYRTRTARSEEGGLDYGIPSIAETSDTGGYAPAYDYDVGIDTQVGFPTWDISEPEPKPETDSWEEEFSYAGLDQQATQFAQKLEAANENFNQKMEYYKELLGFEKKKWEDLTDFQQEKFDFTKQQWEDQKAQFQQTLTFQKEQWKEQLAILKEKSKRRPPPVWGI